MTEQNGVVFRVVTEHAPDCVAMELRQLGFETEIEAPEGIVPLAVALLVLAPPGIALLAAALNRIVERWRKPGVRIDAREDGPPEVQPLPGTPYGTVVILSKDGARSERTDLPEADLGDYMAKAIGALTGGASVSEADAKAS